MQNEERGREHGYEWSLGALSYPSGDDLPDFAEPNFDARNAREIAKEMATVFYEAFIGGSCSVLGKQHTEFYRGPALFADAQEAYGILRGIAHGKIINVPLNCWELV